MPNAFGCECIWDGIDWICVACGFTTRVDAIARMHSMTGVERIMDELGVED